MVGFDGIRMNSDLRHLITTLKIGGVILFARNISGPEQLLELSCAIQETARKAGMPPLFIAIDQEGGQVARLKEPFTQFPGNPSMQGEDDAAHFATDRASADRTRRWGDDQSRRPLLSR